MASLLAKVGRVLGRKLQEGLRAELVVGERAAPIDGGRGVSPADGWSADAWDGAEPIGEATMWQRGEFLWRICPESGDTLPNQPASELSGEGWAEARSAHRQEIAVVLARCWRESGREDFANGAIEALESWLAYDRSEVGVGWIHSSDLAVRVMRWGLISGWLREEIDPGLERLIAGAVLNHARSLEARLSLLSGDEDHRLVVQASGLVVAGLMWPNLPGAGGWWSRGLSLLGRYLDGVVLPDGSPVGGDPGAHLMAIEAALVARAFAVANGVGFPAGADSAIIRGAWFLRVLEGDGDEAGLLETRGVATVLPPWGCSKGRSLHAAVVAAGLATVDDDMAEGEIDRNATLLAGVRACCAAPLDRGDGWGLHAFRDGGWALAQADDGRFALATRLALRGAPLQPIWSARGVEVLASPASISGVGLSKGELLSARAEPRRVVVRSEGGGSGGRIARECRLRGARLEILDRHEGGGDLMVVWHIAAGWSDWEQDGATFKAKSGDVKLTVKLSEELEWRRDEQESASGTISRLLGRGAVEPGSRIASRFELR